MGKISDVTGFKVGVDTNGNIITTNTNGVTYTIGDMPGSPWVGDNISRIAGYATHVILMC